MSPTKYGANSTTGTRHKSNGEPPASDYHPDALDLALARIYSRLLALQQPREKSDDAAQDPSDQAVAS